MEQAGEVAGYVDDGRSSRIGSEKAGLAPTRNVGRHSLPNETFAYQTFGCPGFCVVYRIGNAAATWELVGAGSLLKRPPRGVSKYHVRVDFPPEGTCLPLTP
ncbi:hypothetical protein M514_10214 [Trichuris suis]|uniref:Uncharacterized protein n=1 Tax=Trichuris suis TaxID=68888 RepID=A0A085N9V3_9BILA|nr:hypothetical protein M513_10214 [Trichuris suis]KFD66249.1 hypothetical protein M514_10214 [Trichuris suis]